MAINNPTIEARPAQPYAPTRAPTRRTIAIGVMAVVAAIVTLVAIVQNADQGLVRPTPRPATVSRDDIVRDLVNRGLVPSQTLQPAPQSHDDIVRDLVNRGLVPAAALED